MGNAEASAGHHFRSYGFLSRDFFAVYADGTILGEVSPLKEEKLLKDPVQLLSPQIGRGMAGAPVLDLERNLVVGIISMFYQPGNRDDAGRGVAWAINAQILSCPPFNLIVQDTMDI